MEASACLQQFLNEVLAQLGGAEGHAALCSSGRVFIGEFAILQDLTAFIRQAADYHALKLNACINNDQRLSMLREWLRNEVLAPLLHALLVTTCRASEIEAAQWKQEWQFSGTSFAVALPRLEQLAISRQQLATNHNGSFSQGSSSAFKFSAQGVVAAASNTTGAQLNSGTRDKADAATLAGRKIVHAKRTMSPAPNMPSSQVGIPPKVVGNQSIGIKKIPSQMIAGSPNSVGTSSCGKRQIPQQEFPRPGSKQQCISEELVQKRSTQEPDSSAGNIIRKVANISKASVQKTSAKAVGSSAKATHNISNGSLQKHITKEVCSSARAICRKEENSVKASSQKRSAEETSSSLEASRRVADPSTLAARKIVRVKRQVNNVDALIETQGWALLPVDDATKGLLAKMISVTRPEQLGKVRDVGNYKRKYNSLEIHHAWRIKAPERRQTFEAQQKVLARDRTRVEKGGVVVATVGSRLNKWHLDSHAPLQHNEGWLLHATKPETVLPILSSGLNERMCSGMFGKGVYLAEDSEKADQYALPDSKYFQDGLTDLHKVLYRAGSSTRHPNEDLFYMFVVRAAFGVPVRTQDGIHDLDKPSNLIFASKEQRELAEVPGISPPMRYHCLVAELGGKISRFREFIHFNSSRFVVEYVISYKRVLK